MKIIRRLLIKYKIIKLKSPDEIHSEKLERIVDVLKDEKQFLVNLLPIELSEKFNKESYVSGGCIYSLYHNDEPKDYDFFIQTHYLAQLMRMYFIDVCGYHGNNIHGGVYKGYPLMVTENAISIGKHQVITRWIGTPEEVVGEFDFLHNQFYFQDDEVKTLSHFKFLKSNELRYNKKRARDIVGTIMRVNKYVKRGMTVKNREVARMLLKLHEVGFNDRELEILQDNSVNKSFGSR